jgi:hypothetical protein
MCPLVFLPAPGDALHDRIAAAPEGSWLKVNVNRYEEVWTPLPQRAQVDGVAFGSPRKLITAWGSMAWDSNRRQLVIWGGGHANYAGNEYTGSMPRICAGIAASLPSAVHAPFDDRRFFAFRRPAERADLRAHVRQPGISAADRSVHHLRRCELRFWRRSVRAGRR